jgi:RNA polymerase sigma-70 factor (ECF subfamily)
MTIDAFELIAPRLRSAALNKAAAMGLDYDESQDIAQETLLRLWQMRDDKQLYNPEGFAAVIAHRLSLNHLRRKPPLPLESRDRASQTISPLDEIIQQEDVQWLEQKINELPSTLHAVMKMRQDEKYSNKQIATLLGIKEDSVSTLLSRARRQLMEQIKKQRRERQ